MEETLLKVTGLNKQYPAFRLQDINFSLPTGYIMGFIGMNGAGKSTTIKSLLNIVKPDSGKVEIMGMDMADHETEIKQSVSFTLGAFDYYPGEKLKKIAQVFSKFYRDWSFEKFSEYVKKFHLDENKRVKELSAGMKVKFALALAFSHNAKLLIFDEPTSGLDPVARDELLDVLRGTVEEGNKSILFSTHITSDLDKCADYILFIRNGQIIACETKDDLICRHSLISGTKQQLETIKPKLIACKSHSLGFTALIENSKLSNDDPFVRQIPNLEDLMVYYNLEAQL